MLVGKFLFLWGWVGMSSRVDFGVVLFAVLFASSVPAASAQDFIPHGDAITGSVLVNASPHQVFQAIKRSRYQEPDRRKVVRSDDTSAVLEENFKGLPIIGDVVCRYKETEIGNQRIEYQILASDKFKYFDGAWELQPVNDGKATLVKLSSHVEAQLRVPFAKQITAVGTRKDIKRRLHHIKCSVEQPQS